MLGWSTYSVFQRQLCFNAVFQFTCEVVIIQLHNLWIMFQICTHQWFSQLVNNSNDQSAIGKRAWIREFANSPQIYNSPSPWSQHQRNMDLVYIVIWLDYLLGSSHCEWYFVSRWTWHLFISEFRLQDLWQPVRVDTYWISVHLQVENSHTTCNWTILLSSK